MNFEAGGFGVLDVLACPYDGIVLRKDGSLLRCTKGHTFHVVEGIPVVLRADVDETIHMHSSSLKSALDYAEGKTSDLWFIDTLGISETEKAGLRAAIQRSDVEDVDPVVSYLVAHTNGILYKQFVGLLSDYPIPELPLPKSNGETLLDVGSGWGRWALAGARLGYRVIGLDPSLGAVMAAKRLAARLGLPFDGVVGDARFLPFLNGSLDVIHSFSVLQHFSRDDAIRSLREFRRTLAPRGRVLVQMASAFGIRSLQYQIKRGFREPKDFEVRYWMPSQIINTFREIFGQCEVDAAAYFGLGLLSDDMSAMPFSKRLLIRCSEHLKRLSRSVKPLVYLADSLYLRSVYRQDEYRAQAFKENSNSSQRKTITTGSGKT